MILDHKKGLSPMVIEECNLKNNRTYSEFIDGIIKDRGQ